MGSTVKPTDITLLAAPGNPHVVDGHVHVDISRPHLDTDSYLSQVFAVREGADPVRVSHGWHDHGLDVAAGSFGLLRKGVEGAPQLHVGAHPGAVRRVTDQHLGVSAFALHPDGAQAAFVSRVPEPGRYGTDPEISPAAEAPRRFSKAVSLANGVGWKLDRPAKLFTVDLAEPGLDPVSLETGEAVPEAVSLPWPGTDVSDPQYSPSGRTLSVVAGIPVADAVLDLRSTVWTVTEEAATPLDLGDLTVRAHAWLDDEVLVLLAQDLTAHRTDFVAQLGGLYVHDRTTGDTRRFTGTEDVDLSGPLTLVDDHAFAVLTDDGAERVVRIPLGSARVSDTEGASAALLEYADLEILTPADHVVNGYTVDGTDLVWTAATPTTAGAVLRAALPTRSGSADAAEATVLADLDALEAKVLPQPVSAPTPLGDVHGWVALPEGEGPFPVILNIHGGPFAQYVHGLFDETQVYTEAGYAVVYSNPRGSGGRGRAWGKAVQEDFADPAAADVLAVLDAALEAYPQLDADRTGVMGGSYGGYLTSMIIGVEHRFRAAIVERGYLVPDSFIGTSDIGRFFSEGYTGTDAENIRRQSPLERARTTRTTTLVMHSELDFRCPLEQAQQYFAALQRNGVTTEMLVFPGENHELSRSGRPRHRVQRFEAILDWWDRHLRTTD
ncbi:alpha/beta hydrolase family protein [Brevibacterium litoralis]|uniref:alpha/beta hydrolase family protein n=1 Tax=Brevibacterium litoralis TaxID=3138935 RepID=UPI0032ED4CA0